MKEWITGRRDELAIGVVFLAVSSFIAFIMGQANPVWIVAILNLAMMFLLVLQRASVSQSISRFRDIVVYELGVPWYETLYSRREQHFIKEKRTLASTVVEDILPLIVDHILAQYPGARLRMVLDSGTTITPMFEKLTAHGVTNSENEQVKCQIITNNLAGIEVVQKQVVGSRQTLTDEDYTLLGGTPLATYRATTGDVTEEAAKRLLTEDGFVTVGILTANWLLVGRAHDTLSLCARGRGHLPFKKLVADHADYLVIVVPLGKIFALDRVEEVQRQMAKHGHSPRGPGDQYEAFTLSYEKKDRTYLVTTRRSADSASPLCVMSAQLFGLPSGLRKNFSLIGEPVEFSPPGSKDEVRKVELPHLWTRKCTGVLFGEVR